MIKLLDIIPTKDMKNIEEAEVRLNQILEVTTCIKCKQNKPLSEFSEDKNGYLGFSNICQKCSDVTKNIDEGIECQRCKEFKSYKEFYKIRGTTYHTHCIKCTKELIDMRGTAGATKQCSECGLTKPATTEYFFATITCKDFLKPLCKVCDNLKKMKRRKI